MLAPEIIKKINSQKLLLKYGEDFILLSQAGGDDHPFIQHQETLAFMCDEEGNVSSWLELAGGPGYSFSDVITEISQYGISKNGWR